MPLPLSAPGSSAACARPFGAQASHLSGRAGRGGARPAPVDGARSLGPGSIPDPDGRGKGTGGCCRCCPEFSKWSWPIPAPRLPVTAGGDCRVFEGVRRAPLARLGSSCAAAAAAASTSAVPFPGRHVQRGGEGGGEAGSCAQLKQLYLLGRKQVPLGSKNFFARQPAEDWGWRVVHVGMQLLSP